MKRLMFISISITVLSGALSVRGSELVRNTKALTTRLQKKHDEAVKERKWIEKQFNYARNNANLLEACVAGKNDTVETLLDLPFIDPNWVDVNGISCLHWATGKGNLAIVTLLIRRNDLDLTASAPNGETARDIAKKQGHKKVAQLLKEAQEKRAIEQTEYPSEYPSEETVCRGSGRIYVRSGN